LFYIPSTPELLAAMRSAAAEGAPGTLPMQKEASPESLDIENVDSLTKGMLKRPVLASRLDSSELSANL
jgi:hypothetical protein